MKCRQCAEELAEGAIVCPFCGATWSEDRFEASSSSSTDTEYKLALGGHRMIMSRRDLKSFIALLVLMLAIMVYALVTLELRIDGGFYLGIAVFALAAVYIGKHLTSRREMGRRRRALLAIAVAIMCVGIATLASGRYLLDTLGPEDGSAEYVNEMTEEYSRYVDYAFVVCVSGALLGLSVLWGSKVEKAMRNVT